MWSIVKKEFNQFFSNLIGYISIILFLLINGVFLFVLEDSNIFNYGYASLDKFFELAPWVLLFLIPAISMRCLSDEYKFGTFETLKTKPLSSNQIDHLPSLHLCFMNYTTINAHFFFMETLA